MLALGLLFILGAAAVTAGAIYDGGEDATFELFGQTIGTSIAGVFLAGVLTMLVFALGLWMLVTSLGRSRRRRHEREEIKARQRESAAQIEEERAQLRAENERLQERLAREGRPASTAPAPGHDGDRATGPDTDLTSREEPANSTSGRHRDEV